MKCRLSICALAMFILAPSRILFGQVPAPTPPTSVKVLVIAETGDPATLPPIASSETPISATSGFCNKVKDVGVAGLVNPASSFFDDPFNAGRGCFIPNPTGVPNGKYRTVGVFVAASCTDANGQTVSPCEGVRSAPSLVFTLAPVLTFPAVPRGWGVKQ